MFSFIAIPVLLSLISSTVALPANYRLNNLNARSAAINETEHLFARAAQAPSSCAGKGKREHLSISKRTAQTDLGTVAESWQKLCLASGGDIVTNDPCVQLAGIGGINALLANGGICDQQHIADKMITFAKSQGINNKQALIDNAIAYRKHPRNALALAGGDTPSTPFCQEEPMNEELKGVVNAQLPGVDPGTFGGPQFPPVPFGDPVSCPFGQKPDVANCVCS